MGRKVDGMVRMQGSGQGDGLRSRLRRGARVNGLWYITPSPSFLEIARSFPLDMIKAPSVTGKPRDRAAHLWHAM
jgi:hypothetical protein